MNRWPYVTWIINRIAHVRLTDRVDDGKPNAFIEVIQSDVHQAGREQGYQDLGKADELRDQGDRAGETWKAARESMGRMIGDALTFEQSTVEIPNPAWSPGRKAVSVPHIKVKLGPVVVAEMDRWPDSEHISGSGG